MIGANTATSDIEMDITVKPTSFEPRSAARKGLSPISSRRTMFSMTTIASSTTKPVETVSAIRERLSSEYPQRYITPNVAINETGAATAGMAVALPLRKKRNVTRITSPMARSRLFSTSRSEARIVSDLSMRKLSSALPGSQEASWGIMALTLSTVSIIFAPGARKIISKIAGLPFATAILRTSCELSTTSATSARRIVRPSFSATINGL